MITLGVMASVMVTVSTELAPRVVPPLAPLRVTVKVRSAWKPVTLVMGMLMTFDTSLMPKLTLWLTVV